MNEKSNAMAEERIISDKEERVAVEEQWKAVQARDQSYDSQFVYGVLSTGIYCKPSCPSRRPDKEKVVFFSDSSSAEKAGFRSCKRCKPAENAGLLPQARLVEQLCNYIKKNSDRKLTLKALGEEMGLSPFYLQRTFKRITGLTPRQYAEASRLDHLKAMLKN